MGRSLFARRGSEVTFSSCITHILKFDFQIPSCLITAVRILLIEDHGDTAAALSIILRTRGYAVETVATAKQALEADLAGLALVISDIGLPDDDGLSLFRKLREKRRIEAIALSGYGTERDVRASLDAGFAAHLTKPIVIETLVAAIEKVLSTGTVNTAAS